MNSLELAYKMKYLSMDSCCGLPPPPLSTSSPSYELDCSRFDMLPSSATSSVSSLSSMNQAPTSNGRGMIKGWGSAISRSRCVDNLSSLGRSSSSDSSLSRPRHYEANAVGPAGSWGYFVDSVADWRVLQARIRTVHKQDLVWTVHTSTDGPAPHHDGSDWLLLGEDQHGPPKSSVRGCTEKELFYASTRCLMIQLLLYVIDTGPDHHKREHDLLRS